MTKLYPTDKDPLSLFQKYVSHTTSSEKILMVLNGNKGGLNVLLVLLSQLKCVDVLCTVNKHPDKALYIYELNACHY